MPRKFTKPQDKNDGDVFCDFLDLMDFFTEWIIINVEKRQFELSFITKRSQKRQINYQRNQ